MRYDKIKFLSGYDGEGYQEIDNGAVVRMTDLDGNVLVLPDDIRYAIIEAESPCPTWGAPDV